MKKLMIGKKEVLIDDSTIQQLSDDELMQANGGTGSEGWNYCRLFCDQCNFASWWNPSKKEELYLVDFHKQMGCDGILRFDFQYFESNPNF